LNYFLRALGSSDSLRGQLVRGGVGSLGINVAHNLLMFAVTIILARMLGPAGYGVYAYVYSLISLLAVPAQFGLPPLIVRETARGQVSMEWGLVRGVVRWSNSIAILFSMLIMLIAGSASLFFSENFTSSQLATFAWGLMLMPLLALGNLRGAVLRGLRKVIQGQFPDKIIRPSLFAAMTLGVSMLVSKDTFTTPLVMALHVVSAFLAFLVGAWLLKRARPVEMIAAKPTYDTSRWLSTVLPLALVAGMHLLNAYAAILTLGIFRSAEEVGIYRVALQGAMLVTFGVSAINMVVAPYFARLYAQDDIKTLQKIVTFCARIGAILALLFVLLYVSFGEIILSWFFGSEYLPGWTALVILSFGRLFNAVAGPVVFLLNMTGHERVMARGVAIAAAMNIFLNLILIPEYGMEGAAVSTMIAVVVWSGLLWNAARKYLGVDSTAFGFRQRVI